MQDNILQFQRSIKVKIPWLLLTKLRLFRLLRKFYNLYEMVLGKELPDVHVYPMFADFNQA